MKQNVSGQEVSAIILDASGNEVTTGTTTVGVNKDGTPGTGGSATYSNGEWRFTPIQSDTNGVKVNFKFSNAGGPPVLVQIFTSFPQSVDNATGIAAIPAAVWTVGTRTLTSFGTLIADIWANVSRTLTDKAGFFISGVKTTLDDLNDLSAAEIPAPTVISNILGTINVDYAQDSGSVTIKRGDVINVPVIINDDLTGKRLFYGARKSSDSSTYAMGDDAGGANEIELINISIVDGVTTAFIPFDGDNNDVESCTYKSEVEARDADGLANPVTAISFDTIVKGDIVR